MLTRSRSRIKSVCTNWSKWLQNYQMWSYNNVHGRWTIQWRRDCTFTQPFATSTGRKLSSILPIWHILTKGIKRKHFYTFSTKNTDDFSCENELACFQSDLRSKIYLQKNTGKKKEKKKSLFYQRARCSDRRNTEFKICHSVLRTCQRFQHLGTMKRKSLLQNVTNISPTHPQIDVSV